MLFLGVLMLLALRAALTGLELGRDAIDGIAAAKYGSPATPSIGLSWFCALLLRVEVGDYVRALLWIFDARIGHLGPGNNALR